MYLSISGEEEDESGGSDDYSDYDIPEGLNLQNLPAGITVRELSSSMSGLRGNI